MGAIIPSPCEFNVNGVKRNEAHVIRGITENIVHWRIYDRTRCYELLHLWLSSRSLQSDTVKLGVGRCFAVTSPDC